MENYPQVWQFSDYCTADFLARLACELAAQQSESCQAWVIFQCLLMKSHIYRENLVAPYRVTIHIVPNLLLTSKQMLHFSTYASY